MGNLMFTGMGTGTCVGHGQSAGNVTGTASTISTDNIFRTGRAIYFACDVTHASCHKLIQMLKEAEAEAVHELAAANVERIALQKRFPALKITAEVTPIVLHLTTYGGIIHAAFAVIDVMSSLKVPVHTVVSGYVASAGTLISVAGAKRFIGCNAYMMIHELRGGCWGRFAEVREQGLNLSKLMTHITAFYESKSRGKLVGAALASILARDLDWDAHECVENGLADALYLTGV